MARKSKYEKQSNKLSTALWKTALYIRLSREDGDREESNSIASQRELLTEFANTQTDMAAPRLYTDDGYTGTDFDRISQSETVKKRRFGSNHRVCTSFGRAHTAPAVPKCSPNQNAVFSRVMSRSFIRFASLRTASIIP